MNRCPDCGAATRYAVDADKGGWVVLNERPDPAGTVAPTGRSVAGVGVYFDVVAPVPAGVPAGPGENRWRPHATTCKPAR